MNTKTAKIRELNDNLRTQLIGGQLFFSAGVSAEARNCGQKSCRPYGNLKISAPKTTLTASTTSAK